MFTAAALLFAAAAPAPQPTASVVAVARARILRPAEVTRTGRLASDRAAALVTHSSPRRDGALVVDCY